MGLFVGNRLQQAIGHNNLNYGFDVQHNLVNSTANEGTPSRYADGGSDMSSSACLHNTNIQLQNPLI